MIQAVPDFQILPSGSGGLSWWVYVVTADGTTQAAQMAMSRCSDSSRSGTGIAACPGTPVARRRAGHLAHSVTQS
jgi:hypothetical protein